MSAVQNKLAAAFAAHQNGNLTGAEKQYRSILRGQPNNPDLLYLLGMLCLDTDRAGMAAGFFDRALGAAQAQRRRVDPEWLLAMGTARQRDGDPAGALEAYERALEREPGSVSALFCRATALQDLERTDEAIEAYKTLLDRAPRHAEAAYNFGVVLRDSGKPENAAKALRKAVLLKPDYAEAHAVLASVLEDIGWREDAIAVYRRAAELAPDDMEVAARYSRSLMFANRVDEAEAVLQHLIEAHPDSYRLLGQLSLLRLFQNDREGAIAVARRALAETDEMPAVHATLAEADANGDHEAAIREIEQAVERGAPDKEGAAALEFAWARRLDYLRRHEEAFEHYAKGNATKREAVQDRGVVYDREREEQHDRLLSETFPAGGFPKGSGSDSEVPLFVVGMPRSGTTLTEQILASHPRIAGAGELIAIGNAAKRLGEALGYPQNPPTQTALGKIAGQYIERLRRVDGDALRVVDKMPGNFRHLGLIAMLFPNARVVHCRRDPVDTCLSCYFQNFAAAGLSWSFDLGDLVHQYARYRAVMDHWRAVLPLRMLEIDYEETVTDLEAQARRLIAFAGLEWDAACLSFHKSEQAVITASHSQVRKPIYKSSVGRWKRYGPGVVPLAEGLAEFLPNGTKGAG